jgi:hypothetical protein
MGRKHCVEDTKQLERKWHILFCDEQMAGCPVTEFIEACRPKHQVKILRFLSLLEEQGPILPRPYADLLYDGIHELRVKLSGDQIRILYFFCYQKFIVLYYAFVKTAGRVPDKFIHKVIAYRNEFLEQASSDQLEEIVSADV